jgi:ABC-type transport system involved in cytochrome bd biosynthesis fused ATPase/permease subunit
MAAVLMGRNKDYTGSVTVGGAELKSIAESSLMKNMTYISHQSYLFKGTVRDNLLMGNPQATDEELWSVLEKMRLADFMKSENGLDTLIQEKGSNLSGGQCQRLALSRALLHDSPVYIFDEATSNIDVESENDIMEQIHKLAETKTVILISHRLANVAGADCIYVLEHGRVVENGTHQALLAVAGTYQQLWTAQQELESYVGKEDALQ